MEKVHDEPAFFPQRPRRGALHGLALVAIAGTLAGCAHEAGTEPLDMSTVEHESAALDEERQAEEHGGQYDAAATRTTEHCTQAQGKPCWTSRVNPTEAHAHEAAEHRAHAAEHRAASQSLRDAEARSCAGLDEADRDESPFAHREDIRSVTPLREERSGARATAERTAGAEIVFRAVPGLTAEWLQRIVDCHLARNAALGHEAASVNMPYCPLAVRGAEASVRSVTAGFAVDVRADDSAAADEILRRAQLLTSSE